MEPSPQFDQGRNTPSDSNLAFARRHDACDQFQDGAFAASIASDYSQGFATIEKEADIAKGVEGIGPSLTSKERRDKLP